MGVAGDRRAWACALALALATGLASCTPVDESRLWVVEPLAYESALEDEPQSSTTDVTYVMHTVADDTAGGFWSASSGSWLHVDAEGETARRFNDFHSPTPNHLASVSPTVLLAAVAPPFNNTPHPPGLYRVDTSADRWKRLPVTATRVGAIAVQGDRTIYVDYADEFPLPDGEGGRYTIRAIDGSGAESVVLQSDPSRLAAETRVATDASGLLWVATESSTFTVDPEGTLSLVAGDPAGVPVLAVNTEGTALVASEASAIESREEWRLSGGSREARSIVERSQGRPLMLIRPGEEPRVLPFTANAIAAVWLDESTFVAAIPGSGDESVLLRVRVPAGDK